MSNSTKIIIAVAAFILSAALGFFACKYIPTLFSPSINSVGSAGGTAAIVSTTPVTKAVDEPVVAEPVEVDPVVAEPVKVNRITKEELQSIIDRRDAGKEKSLRSRMLNCRWVVSNVRTFDDPEDGKKMPQAPHPTSLTEVINRLEMGTYDAVTITSLKYDNDTDKLVKVVLEVTPCADEAENYY